MTDLQGVVMFAHYLEGGELRGPAVRTEEVVFVVPADVDAGSFTAAVPRDFAPAGVDHATEFTVHRFRARGGAAVRRADLQRALPDAVRLFGQTP